MGTENIPNVGERMGKGNRKPVENEFYCRRLVLYLALGRIANALISLIRKLAAEGIVKNVSQRDK